jgi:potassium-dependent mechanosensitive channel
MTTILSEKLFCSRLLITAANLFVLFAGLGVAPHVHGQALSEDSQPDQLPGTSSIVPRLFSSPLLKESSESKEELVVDVDALEKRGSQLEKTAIALEKKVQVSISSTEETQAQQNSLTHVRAVQALIKQRVVLYQRLVQARSEANQTNPTPKSTAVENFSQLEKLRSQEYKLSSELKATEEALRAMRSSRQMLLDRVRKLEAEFRALKEGKADNDAATYQAKLEEAQFALDEARGLADVKELEQELAHTQSAGNRTLLTEIKTSIQAGQKFKPSKAERKELFQAWDKRQEALAKDLKEAEEAYASIQGKYGDVLSASVDSSSPVAVRDRSVLLFVADAAQKTLGSIQEMVSRHAIVRTVLEHRFSLMKGGVARAKLIEWQEWSTEQKERLAIQERQVTKATNEIHEQSGDVQGSEKYAALFEEQRKQVQRWLQKDLKDIESTQALFSRFDAELKQDLPSINWIAALQSVYSGLAAAWNYELFVTVDDRPITVSKLVFGFLLLAAGFLLAKRLSATAAKFISRRLGLTESGSAVLQTLVFYLLFFLMTLLALRLVNVPLTVFAFLGGALAIGVGFGSQNLVKNFISGLILFTERPIKVGDFLEIDGRFGRVRHIGGRSTIIRTSSNVDIVIPNSSFLEQSVVNWTRDDHVVRLQVTVGVAYGTPTQRVKTVLLKAVEENPKILRKGEALVIFGDFAASSLVFHVHFWANVKTLVDKWTIESELRFKIDELFRENGIEISYNQLDVHLDSKQPIPFTLVGDSKRTSAGGAE